MGLNGGLPSHPQHFQLHLTDVLDMLQHILADSIHHFTDFLEVVTYLLEELGPILFSQCLRNHLCRCQQQIMLDNVDIPLVPSPLSSHTISTPLQSQIISPVLIGCCGSLAGPNQDSPSASSTGELDCPTDRWYKVGHAQTAYPTECCRYDTL